MQFHDRRDAGRILAKSLNREVLFHDPIVVALPRGGVPVGYEIAKEFQADLEILVVRKIGAPDQPEFAIGAMAEDGSVVMDESTLERLNISRGQIRFIVERERAELQRRVSKYRNGLPPARLVGRSVILVDDGLATGLTARAACAYLLRAGAAHVLLAAPACSPRSADRLRDRRIGVYCVVEPTDFIAVGEFYKNFSETTDEEVISLLAEAKNFATIRVDSLREG